MSDNIIKPILKRLGLCLVWPAIEIILIPPVIVYGFSLILLALPYWILTGNDIMKSKYNIIGL